MSRISIEKMDSVAREYKLGGLARWPKPDERPHLPPVGFMAISEAILKVGVFLPLHPFIDQVLKLFDIAPFQLTSNSYRIMVSFFITFSEAYRVEPSLGHFAYIFGIKTVAKYAGFLYLIGHGDAAGIGGLPSNVGQWKNDFFFYQSAHSREFRIGHK